MERQFLTILYILIFLVSCQQVEINQSNPKDLIVNNKVSSEALNDNKIYLNIWDYIYLNSYKDKVTLNEKILSYMNLHLQDLDKFEEYLSDSYYFIYFAIEEEAIMRLMTLQLRSQPCIKLLQSTHLFLINIKNNF